MWRQAVRAIAAAAAAGAGGGARTTAAAAAAAPAAATSFAAAGACSLTAASATTGPSGPSIARALLQQQQRAFFAGRRALGGGSAGVVPRPATTTTPSAFHTASLPQRPLALLAARTRAGLRGQQQHHHQQPQQQQHHHQQHQQQRRTLLGVPTRAAKTNYQNHNTKRPERTKPRTPSAARRRIIVAADGSMWRTQAGRRHYRSPKSGGRLRALKGLAPVVPSLARKLRKLGYDRTWWYCHKKA